MTVFTRHPAHYEIGILRPKHSLCIPCLQQTAFAAANGSVTLPHHPHCRLRVRPILGCIAVPG